MRVTAVSEEQSPVHDRQATESQHMNEPDPVRCADWARQSTLDPIASIEEGAPPPSHQGLAYRW